jgi:chromosome segregation ATPase
MTNTPIPSNANNNTSGAPTMNATMANSMAAKLSDAELNAIIVMTERLKQKEALTDKLAKENEALLAKLDGTEGVKQFLINKVRDMEVSLSSLIQNETKVVQQIASDQEVIAFLDGRVQELEHVTQVLQTDKEVAKTELDRIQKQSAQKVTVISDMLQFEREKLADQEREWKMTKKLLVKEVKNCRSQIIALQSERDGYREQSETLRRALLTPSSNHHSSNIGNSSKHRDRAFA